MENTTEVEYISIYEKPRRGRGRPKTCTLTEEEKRQRKIDINRRYYRDNYEYCTLRQRIYAQRIREEKKLNNKKNDD